MNATLYLLDTSILLALVRGGLLADYIRATFKLEELVARPLASIVSHGELRAIADRRAWSAGKRKTLVDLLEAHVTLDLGDEAIVQSYVEADAVSRRLAGGARTIGDNDQWIAATAKAADAVLLTADKDFLHFSPAFCRVHYVDPKSRLIKGPSPSGQSAS